MKYNGTIMKIKSLTRAFSLIEILLVVVIIGVLAAIMLPDFAGRSELERLARAKTEIESTIGLALNMFEADTGNYPTTQLGLRALLMNPENLPNWKGPYIKKSNEFLDPWQNEYYYCYPGQKNIFSYDLVSPGPDGQLGTKDDITNIEEQ